MRGFGRTRANCDLYEHVLGDGRYSVQVVRGANDPALKLTAGGEAHARRPAGRVAGSLFTSPCSFPRAPG